ncbi:hypothetical protein BGZ60DRAFT_569901 [Tricladium varicosporioides]|nr:hypothetical protein BGZ60DRAFT_569901 [Hymenoscyphus varicosporioides]
MVATTAPSHPIHNLGYSSASTSKALVVTSTSTASSSSGTDLALKRDWNVNASDFSNLEPKKSCRMLYAKQEVPLGNKPPENDPYAWVNMNETEYPIIQTVNSKYYEKVWCDVSAGWVKMQFTTWDAYNYAWDSWHVKSRGKWGDYVVITPELSCKNYNATQQRYFIQAVSEQRDDASKTITCQTKDISLADTVGEKPTEVEFENFNQPNVSAQANEATTNGNFTNLGGEVLKDPSGDSDFDEYRDTVIGRMDLDSLNNSTLSQFNITLEDFYGGSDLPDLVKQNLGKRKIGDKIKKAVKKVATAVKTAVKTVANTVKTVATAVVDAAKALGKSVADFTTIDQELNKNIDFDTTKFGTIVTTPFSNKRGYELFHGEFSNKNGNKTGGVDVSGAVDVFCVDCGVKADLKIRGKVVFVISRLDFEEGFVEVTGTLGAGMGVGIVADLTLTKEFEKQLASIPLQPFAIPNVFNLGPKLDLSAGVDFELKAQGQLLTGVDLQWPSISARMDLVNSGGSFARGFKPVVTPVFEVESSITLTTTFFLEAALGVGINILNGAFDKSIELVERPGIFVSAGIGASFSLEGLQGSPETGCLGLQIAVGLSNEVSVNIFDIDSFALTLSDESVELGSRCIPFRKKRDEGSLLMIEGRQEEPIGNTKFDGGILIKMTTRDDDKAFRLRYSPNGNTYAVEESKVPAEDKNREWSGWFASDPSGVFVFGDSHGRFYHGYRNTLLDFGVSRLRLHKPDEMPQMAQPMVFASVIPDSNSSSTALPYMVISDLGGDVYFPIICVYANKKVYPKFFLANDTQTGVNTLLSNSPEILKEVTGGNLKECGYVPLTSGIAGMDIEFLS